MKGEQLYRYRVTHPEYGEIETPAKDRLQAVCQAAKAWGIGWTAIARECSFERLGPAPEQKKTPPGKRAAGKGDVKQ